MLLLDLGNSRLKWAFVDAEEHRYGALPWAEVSVADLVARWRGLSSPAWVLGAAVATPARRATVETALDGLAWPAPRWLVSPARRGQLINAYRYPADLGIDRFLAMAAALQAGHAPCVVASCGSALTLDALDARGRHLGGRIAPGADAMLAALRSAAPGLPDALDGRVTPLADRTADAMQSGVLLAVVASIEHFMGAAEAGLGVTPTLLLSGGGAAALGPLLSTPWQRFEHAVLRGLEVWAADDA